MNLMRRTSGLYPSFLEDFFDDNWSGVASRVDTGTKIPAVNVREKDDIFEIQVAVPGMKREGSSVIAPSEDLSVCPVQ